MATPTIGLESLPWEYDVFLSFRGEDTRKTFTGHLYTALHHATINTFIDDEELKRGEYLAPAFTRAIQSSRISMIIFSKNYASSKWCLEELVQILECKEKGKQLVYPIFYDVDPSEVRNQRDVYGLALAEHEKKFVEKKIDGKDKIQKWKDALTKVGNMSGWHLQGIANGYEAKFIDEIINEVKSVVKRVPMLVSNHVVGIESQVKHVVRSMWRERDNSVRMIGIYGVDGMGKTTLARVLYNKFFEYFERSCFLEISSDDTKIRILQERFLSVLLNRKDIKVNSEGEGMMFIKNWLQTKKCLVVLDNLEDRDQFKALCGERYWFGAGSRIILTTRDAQLLNELEKGERYEIKALDHERSLQLFSHHAFKGCFLSKEDYIEILDDMVVYCEGMPLALEVIGASLCNESKEQWMNTFEKLKKIPNKKVLAKLKISFDGLHYSIKSLFLDLVCFSNGVSKETINRMGYSTEIQSLVGKCLIKCSESWISMHSLIQDMGREIICEESPNNPSKRSRLWCPNDIHDVLIGQKGTENIEVIVFNESPIENMKYSTEAFKNMENLRFLRIKGERIHIDGTFKHLSKKLRCLEWDYCPLKYINISSNSYFGKLVMLELVRSNIKEFQAPLKYFPCLESLDLSFSKYLTKTPDFSGAQRLHTLSFWQCKNLVNVHSSLGELVSLKVLKFGWCSKLRKLPNNLCQLLKLESIDLQHCKKLQVLPKLPHSVNRWSLINCVNLSMIEEFPPFTDIDLCDCKNLEKLPQLPPDLERVDLSGCEKLKMLPEFPHSVKNIKLLGCKKLKVLPQLPHNLEWIDLSGCEKLKMLPLLPPNLSSITLNVCAKLKMLPELPQKLRTLEAKNCVSLEKVPNLSNNTSLYGLDFSGCGKLKEIPGWESLPLLMLNLGGIPHILVSHTIKELLTSSKLMSRFTCTLTCNEIPSWIGCTEEGWALSFQWPLCDAEDYTSSPFLGLFFWVVFKPQPIPEINRGGEDLVTIQINGINVNMFVRNIQLEAEEISFLHWSPRQHWSSRRLCICLDNVKGGDVMTIALKTSIGPSIVKKIGVAALYKDDDGLRHFVPITKVGLNTKNLKGHVH
ncbi:TMV resistance protein N-like [Ipomoea triloba]|uniref:TMV resistance protein N-like n=1 Tax=Ipomoea triloba TaxID=35885 RepID=UPI00125D1C29|nr:TMV resistance protein N-like [Ipomoea triloba]